MTYQHKYYRCEPLFEENFGKLKKLLQIVHERNDPEDYIKEYPVMFSNENLKNLRVAIYEPTEEIVSHVGVCPRLFNINNKWFPIILIGSVATHPDHRNNGIASYLINNIHEEMSSLGFSLSILWAEVPTLYEKLGYYPVGRSFLFFINKKNSSIYLQANRTYLTNDKYKINKVSQDSTTALLTLYNKRYSSIYRSEKELSSFVDLVGSQTYSLEKNNEIVAFASIGKGSDMKNVVHDWAGNSLDVKRLVHEIAQIYGEDILLLTPDENDDLTMLFLTENWDYKILPVAHACVINENLVRNQIENANIIFRKKSTNIPVVQQILGSVDGTIDSLFPFYIWGFDSI